MGFGFGFGFGLGFGFGFGLRFGFGFVWWAHHSWRERHQSRMLSSHLNHVFSCSTGMILSSPLRTWLGLGLG